MLLIYWLLDRPITSRRLAKQYLISYKFKVDSRQVLWSSKNKSLLNYIIIIAMYNINYVNLLLQDFHNHRNKKKWIYSNRQRRPVNNVFHRLGVHPAPYPTVAVGGRLGQWRLLLQLLHAVVQTEHPDTKDAYYLSLFLFLSLLSFVRFYGNGNASFGRPVKKNRSTAWKSGVVDRLLLLLSSLSSSSL